MKYHQPFGISDLNASYVNGDPSLGRAGSIPPGESFEFPQREVVNMINNSGITPDDGDLFQLAKAIRSQALNYLESSGAVNHLVVSPTLPLAAYIKGLPLRVKVQFDNTLASYINVGGLGEVEIVKANGSSLVAGELKAGQVACLVFDGIKFQLQNFLGLSAGNTYNNYYNTGIPYCHDTSVVPNAVIAPFNPVLLAATDGEFIAVKMANQNTGPMTIAVNALATKAIIHGDGSACIGKEVAVGQIALLCYDGVAWQFVGIVGGTTGTGGGPPGGLVVLDTSVFNGAGSGMFAASPQMSTTLVPFSSASPGAGANCSLVGGSCRILKSGRYSIQCSGTVQLIYGGFSGSDSAPAEGHTGFIYLNGGRQESSNPMIDMTRMAMLDCVAGDNLGTALALFEPFMGGANWQVTAWNAQMWVTRQS